ncbi:MAG: TrkA family potassium uptake protein [Acholeplasmatales bacterium]|nr:TrkA family potassium uptake protein [Acholeplasmatales bacterium]
MKKSFMIIGLGRFGANVAITLADLKCDLVAVDIDEEAVQNVSAKVNHCVVADATKMAVLQDLGATSIDHAVVCIGNNLQASILAVLNLKKLGVKTITVRADEIGHREVFMQLGATDVIIPEEASAISLANSIVSDGLLDYYQLADNYAIVKVSVGKNFTPQSIVEIGVREKFGVNIVGLIRNEKFIIPRGTDVLNPGDIVSVIGVKQKVKKFDAFLNE